MGKCYIHLHVIVLSTLELSISLETYLACLQSPNLGIILELKISMLLHLVRLESYREILNLSGSMCN